MRSLQMMVQVMVKVMEKANFEGLFPFILILVIYFITNLRKASAKRKEAEMKRQSKNKATSNDLKLEPTKFYKPPSPPTIKKKVKKTREQKEPAFVKITNEKKDMLKTNLPRRRKTFVKGLFSEPYSKKKLIYFSEILNKKDFF